MGWLYIGGPNMRPPTIHMGLGYISTSISNGKMTQAFNLQQDQIFHLGNIFGKELPTWVPWSSELGPPVMQVAGRSSPWGPAVAWRTRGSPSVKVAPPAPASWGLRVAGVYRLKLQHLDSLHGWHSSQLSLHGFLIQFCMHRVDEGPYAKPSQVPCF